MKKAIILAAISILAAASCAKQETVSSNLRGNAIEFRTADITKAADITTGNLQVFNVTAFTTSDDKIYFSNVEFTKNPSGTFVSPDKLYWPTPNSLNFYAYAPCKATTPAGQITVHDYKTFTVTPDNTKNSATQTDLVFTSLSNVKEPESGSVALKFRHAESKIRVQVNNTSSTIKMEVEGWKIGGISGKGIFSFSGFDSYNFCKVTDWSLVEGSATEYIQTLPTSGKIAVAPKATSPVKVANELILIPQSKTKASAPKATDGAYIAVKMKVMNAESGTVLVGSESEGAWCYWPVDIAWTPGRSYTYSIDLSGTNELGNPITFVDVEVYNWDEPDSAPSEYYSTKTPEIILASFNPRDSVVDLGLSVKWASCNVGASKPEEYGTLFAFGEVSPKAEYTQSNYAGFYWGRLPLEKDAAYVNKGSKWRMATFSEWNEIREKCTCDHVILNGVYGIRATGKNGNWIFLPSNETGSHGIYNTSDYYEYSTPSEQYSRAFYFDRSIYTTSLYTNLAACGNPPYRGAEIRAVLR